MHEIVTLLRSAKDKPDDTREISLNLPFLNLIDIVKQAFWNISSSIVIHSSDPLMLKEVKLVDDRFSQCIGFLDTNVPKLAIFLQFMDHSLLCHVHLEG